MASNPATFDYETARARTKTCQPFQGFPVSESQSQRPPVVGAWSVNPRHAVISLGAGWRYIACSEHLSVPPPGGLEAPKAGPGLNFGRPDGYQWTPTERLRDLLADYSTDLALSCWLTAWLRR